MSLQPQESLIAEESVSTTRPSFGLGRFLFRRSRASRRRGMSRQADHHAVTTAAERSECLENRLMLTQFIVDTNLDVVNGSDGLTSLREAITAANSNAGADTIDFIGTFGAFEPIVLSLGELTITEGLTINGSTAFSLSVEVDGDDLSRVFNIDTTDAVTFIGVDITGGAAVDGAGIFNNGSDLTYQFGIISSNNATGSGGGIFNAAGTVSIEQSNINDNTAVRAGGGIEDQSNDANAITFTNGNLNGNSATGGVAGPGNGGGLHVTGSGNVTITNVSVTGNTAASEGGGLWNGTGTMTISDTSGNVLIDGNTASGNDANNGGGGIFNAGGTVLIQDNDPTNTITISNNIADGTSGSGGGILNDAGGTLTVTGATISGNAANRAGGGIESTAGTTNTLTSVTLIDNVAGRAGSASPGNGGGLHITGNGNADIMGGSVTGNFAASEGGGLWNGSGTMTIDGTMITGNAAAGNGADQGGGGVFNAGGTLDIDNAMINNNLAAAAITFSLAGSQEVPPVTTTAAGSAIAQLNPATGTFRLDLFVTGMELPTNPGGLPALTMAHVHVGAPGTNGPVIIDLLALGSFVQEDNGLRLILDGEMFPEANLPDLLAGNTYVNIHSDDNMSGEIRGQIIVPSTMGSGGGILNDQGTLTVDNSTIDGNIASRAGGGIETNVGMTMLTNVTLSNNVAGPDGAATPGNGGGLHVTGAGGVLIDGGTITGNNAAAEGGGLWNGSGTLTISDSAGNVLIDGNTASGAGADQGGGGIFNAGGTVLIQDNDMTNTVTISNNVADGTSGSGGGILNDANGTLTVTGAVIDNNSANRAGGGIEATAGTMTTLTNVSLTNNDVDGGAGTANPGNGGGLHITGNGNVLIDGGTITGNDAAAEGGGLWNGTGTMTITDVSGNVLIDSNTASGALAPVGPSMLNQGQGGGGIFNEGGTVQINDTGSNTVIISNNRADGAAGSGGGIFNNVGGTLTVTGAVISGNTANRAGGGIEDVSGQFTLVELTDVNLDGNSAGVDIGDGATAAPGNGGGLHVTGPGVVVINDGTVNNNVAAAEGGGLWNASGDMNVIGTTISGNTAFGTGVDQGGGGIFNAGGNVDVSGATLSSNTATSGFGAGIFNEGGTVSIGMTSIQGDVAGGDLTDDTFNIFESSVTIISQGGDDATSVAGTAADETFAITRDTVGAGVTLTITNGAAYTVNSDSESLSLTGDDGDDSFTVDFGSQTNLGTVTNLSINGDDETSADSLTLTGTAAFSRVVQVTTSSVDGSFNINDVILLVYASIESVVDELVRGLSLGEIGDQTIGAGAGPVDIRVQSATDDGEIPVLSVGTLPSYATFVDNGNGTGVLTFNPLAADAGSMADITVTTTASGVSFSDTFTVSVVTPDQTFPNNTIFSINSGGGAVGSFARDNFFNTGSTFRTGSTIDVSDGSIPGGTPAGIFNTTRFDFNGGSELQYAFPTGVGAFEVTLFFAEIYSPVFRTGGRVFDVSIEGVLVLDDFDVFATAGAGNKGIARTFTVNSDGTLNIDFGHVVENPMVMGIQIVDLNPVPNRGPQLASVTPVTNLLSGNSTTINVSATDPEGDAITLSASGLPPFASFVDNGNGTGTITVNSVATDAGVFGISVQASSGTPALTDSTSFTLSVAPFVPQPLPNEVININGGGPALPGDPGFVRDDNFQNGVGLDFGTGANIDTSDASIPSGTPAQLFKTVTYDRAGGAELQFDIPTQHTGITYEVTLFFVEIYGPTARTGARVFDVSIDGVLVLDNFDIFAAAGAINRGIARTFSITSDGNVDIDFGHVVENPALAGVSVRQIDQVFTSP